MREIFRREGARLSQQYDFRRMMIYKGRHRSEMQREGIQGCCISSMNMIKKS